MIARTSSNPRAQSTRRFSGRRSSRYSGLLLSATIALGLVAVPYRRPGLVPRRAGDLVVQQSKRRIGGRGRRPSRACRYLLHPDLEGDQS